MNKSLSHPHFILHFDVNKTIVCFDHVQDLNVDETLTLLFAEKIAASWEGHLDPMTYKRYVKRFVVPGSELDHSVKKRRLCQYQELWTELKHIDLSLYNHYRNEWAKAKDLLSSHHVFPSFFRLLQFLKSNNIEHSIILRTFGKDLDVVIEEIYKSHPELVFTKAKFSKGKLYIPGQEFSEIKEIQDFLCQSHVAIQDDHHHWHYVHQEQFSGAKPFPFERNERIITLFFDDNLKRKQIVQVVDLNNPPQNLTHAQLIQQGILLPVDTLEAIENEHYFTEHLAMFVK